MFNISLCNAATICYSQLKLGRMHLCGMDYIYFLPHFCKCNSFGCTATIRCGNACHGSHSDSLYSGSEHSQFNSPRLVKREAGFPNPRRALIGSNQLWCVNDSQYYRELTNKVHFIKKGMSCILNFDNWQLVSKYSIFNSYSLVKELITLQYSIHKMWVFQFNFRFIQNVVQTTNHARITKLGMQQNCLCNKLYPSFNKKSAA